MDAGYETEYRIFENQHQDGGRSPQSGQQVQRRYVEQGAYGQDNADTDQSYLHDLYQSFERFVAESFLVAEDAEKYLQENVDENQYDDDAVNDAELAEPAEDFGLVRKGQRQQHVNDQYRY